MMMTNAPDMDQLAEAFSAKSEFEAQVKAAVLKAEGVEAFVFPGATAWMGGMEVLGKPIPVWVRRSDVDRAMGILAQATAESVDLDWNEVDVGEEERTEATAYPTWVRLRPWVVFAALALGCALVFIIWTLNNNP